MPQPITETLSSLGLSSLEAELYVHLLSQAAPVTAYRAGQALGKATANVYKAMDSLAQKGAVTIEEGDPRLCRAAAPEEFLRQLERRFQERRRHAAGELAKLGTVPAEERIYRLVSVPLVLERARVMLGRARRVVVIDGFPKTLAAIAPAIVETAARGVAVRVLAYAPIELAGAEVVVAPCGEVSLGFWRSQQLNLVVDAEEALIALVDNELGAVLQALWTDNLYLACLLHAGFGMERTFHHIETLRGQISMPPELIALLDQQGFFFNSDLPGQRRLMARHGAGTVETPTQ
jgi:HTH-type transcriptional regulator, sugar sensing transcriptional regulator